MNKDNRLNPNFKISASQINCDLDDRFEELLPVMQTNIMLECNEKVLIIDAKFYNHILQTQYNTDKIRSNHLYQIYTYVKNFAKKG